MQQSERYPFPVLLTALFAVGMCAAHFVHIPVSDSISPWHLALYPTVNTLPAKFVYCSLVLMLALGALRKLFNARPAVGGFLFDWGLVGCVGFGFAVGSPVSLPFTLGFWGLLTAWLYLDRDCRLFVSTCEWLGRVFFRPFAIVVLLASLIFCELLPLITPVVAGSVAQLVSLNNHYSGFLPGIALATGAHAGPIGVLNYGWGPALLVGSFYSVISPLAPDLVRLSLPIKFYQLVALLCVIAAVRAINRKHWFALCALVLLATPTFSSVSDAIYYPNLSGIRFLSILFMVFLLARSTPPGLLGFAAALSLVYALETGVAASIGAFAFVLVSSYRSDMGIRSVILPLSRFFGGLSAFVPLAYLLGGLQNWGVGSTGSSFIADFASGFCGISTLPGPFSILVFFFASYVVCRGCARAGCGFARKRDAYQAGVGAMMLVWLFYYINRMHPYNLWFQSALLVLLFAPRVGGPLVRLLRCGSVSARSSILCGAALLVGLLCEHVVASVRDVRELYCRVTAVSGVTGDVTDLTVPEPFHTQVVSHLSTLREITSTSEYLVVSNLSTDVRLLGFNEGMPWYDLSSDLLTHEAIHRAVYWMDRHGPQFILLDAPESVVAQEAAPQFGQLKGIVRSLSTYRETTRHNDWLVFERIQE